MINQPTDLAALTPPARQERLRLLALVPGEAGVPYRKPVEEAISVHRGDAEWFLQNVPCQAACPLGTDVPGYVASVADGDWETALAINRDANVFPNVLCYICARPCEVACRRASLDAPIAIRALKRAAATYATDDVPAPSAALSGCRVAIVGSGPAGLAAARDLVKQGHQVVIWERAPVPGGMLALGIPPFRLPRSAVEQEIAALQSTGVEFHCGADVGRDVSLAELEATFDAVLLAAGCQSPVPLHLPGEDLPGVYDALTFMEHACLERPLTIGERLVVIGAGCAGLDCARAGLRLGARDVAIFDLAEREQLTYDPRDLTEAEEEGIVATFRVRPVRFLDAGERVRAVEFVRMIATQADASGRPSLEPLPGSEFIVPADTVVVAVSQHPDLSWLGDARLPHSANGALAPDPRSGRIGEASVFAAGDFVSGPRYVSEAIAAGRRAARGIHAFLKGAELPRLTPQFQLVTQMEAPFGYQADVTEDLNRRAAAWNPLPDQVPVWTEERPPARWTEGTARRRTFGGEEIDERRAVEPPRLGTSTKDIQQIVEGAFAPGAAVVEAQRCLQCQLNVFIEPAACTLCGGCVNICPYYALQMVAPSDIASVGGAVGDELLEAQRWPAGAAVVLDEDRCVRCGLCLTRCPTRAITVQQFTLARCPISRAASLAAVLANP